MVSIPDSPYSKMSPDSSQARKAQTSEPCSRRSSASATIPFLFLNLRRENGSMPERSWATISPSHGAFRARNTGACPREEIASTLSSILQPDAPEKCYLSSRACEGILRRAKRRGKELPPMLREALEEVLASSVDRA